MGARRSGAHRDRGALETSLRGPENSIGYWVHRSVEHGVRHETPQRRFGEPALPFRDFDGTTLALIAGPGTEQEAACPGASPLGGLGRIGTDTSALIVECRDLFEVAGVQFEIEHIQVLFEPLLVGGLRDHDQTLAGAI